jgi:hypothetical protein
MRIPVVDEGTPSPAASRPARGSWREQLRITWHLPAVLAGLDQWLLIGRNLDWEDHRPIGQDGGLPAHPAERVTRR